MGFSMKTPRTPLAVIADITWACALVGTQTLTISRLFRRKHLLVVGIESVDGPSLAECLAPLRIEISRRHNRGCRMGLIGAGM